MTTPSTYLDTRTVTAILRDALEQLLASIDLAQIKGEKAIPICAARFALSLPIQPTSQE
jgi:hypothetical protein